MTDKTAQKQPAAARKQRGRGRPFQRGESGNPTGRPQGSRHKATLAAEALLEGEAEQLTRVCVERALSGDMVAMRLALERALPVRRGRPVNFALPPTGTFSDVDAAIEAIIRACAAGQLTVDEGIGLASILEKKNQAARLDELEKRLAELEAERSRRNY
jgi:hypothetical protein